jgi:demethylmenaquinone methyltransferase/2-methoxy-6-polyprenyl-1,4-benzoquinol methylase
MRIEFDDNRMQRFMDPVMRPVRSYVHEFAGTEEGSRVLDVCCGAGDQALYYSSRGLIATGIDIDPCMIGAARAKSWKLGLTNVSFQTASAQHLPFSDSVFDYASISVAIHENERSDIDRIISEMTRVVKKDGALILVDYKVPLPRLISAYFSFVLEYIAGRDHWRCFKDYMAQGGLDGILERHGLREEKRDELGPLWVIKTTN